MANPPRQKGTKEETSIVARWNLYWGRKVARRNPASALFDITVEVGVPIHDPIEVLSIRADRGERLYVLREEDFLSLFGAYEFARGTPVHIEAKRYARFQTWTLFFSKFGRTK